VNTLVDINTLRGARTESIGLRSSPQTCTTSRLNIQWSSTRRARTGSKDGYVLTLIKTQMCICMSTLVLHAMHVYMNQKPSLTTGQTLLVDLQPVTRFIKRFQSSFSSLARPQVASNGLRAYMVYTVQ
jgi:hypothetical protein